MSRTGKLYIGAAYAGHLLCFDPDEEALEDLGPINPGAAVFPCRIDEGPNGTIWIGSYGTADLTSYDPTTGRFTRYGPMDDVDMYNHPFVDADGNVVCLIGVTRPHVVAFDPRLPSSPSSRGTLGPRTSGRPGREDLRVHILIYCLDPSTLSLEVVVMAEGAFTVPGPILGKYIYFATGHRLRAAEVF